MKYVIFTVVIVVVILFAISSFLLAQVYRKEVKTKDKELKEARENAERTAEIITEANKAKADARSGDHKRDLDFMANKLHEYSAGN